MEIIKRNNEYEKELKEQRKKFNHFIENSMPNVRFNFKPSKLWILILTIYKAIYSTKVEISRLEQCLVKIF